MGCDCGIRKETKAERDACEMSAKLEGSRAMLVDNDNKVVGGCEASHTPWYVFLDITGELIN